VILATLGLMEWLASRDSQVFVEPTVCLVHRVTLDHKASLVTTALQAIREVRAVEDWMDYQVVLEQLVGQVLPGSLVMA